MRFTGTLVRLGRALAIDGDVSRQPDGSWAGSLTFSRADAPTVAPGPAAIKTDAGGTWDVFISSTHTTMEVSVRRSPGATVPLIRAPGPLSRWEIMDQTTLSG